MKHNVLTLEEMRILIEQVFAHMKTISENSNITKDKLLFDISMTIANIKMCSSDTFLDIKDKVIETLENKYTQNKN